MKTSWRIIQFTFSLLTIAVALFLTGALIPAQNLYKLLIVQSGSMEPAIPVGALVITLPTQSYFPGDIVTFRPTGSAEKSEQFITHRIESLSGERFGLTYVTKGDANKTADPGNVDQEQIVGKVLVTVPFIGYLLNTVKTPQGFILLVIVPATIVIYEETKKLWQSITEGTKRLFKKLRKAKPELDEKDEELLSHSNELRLPETEQAVNILTPSNSHRFTISLVSVFLLCVGLGFVFMRSTNSFFSDVEIASGTLAAAVFPDTTPDPSTTPMPSVSPSPQLPHIVINEVYYGVDGTHGLDSPGDRGILIDDKATQIRISNNGTGSNNHVFGDFEDLCKVHQENKTDVTIDISILGNSGNNSGSTDTGDVTNRGAVDILGGSNSLSSFCNSHGRNHEWIELYNPTPFTVNLKNWTLTDNSGITVTIPGNRFLPPYRFALISKNNSTWAFWNEPLTTLKIPLGRQIGDGLDNAGDRIILKNKDGVEVDAMSYGDDTSEFTLPGVALGHALERIIDGFDTDTADDWGDQFPPMPGT